MLSRYTQRNLTWIDLVHPSPAEVKSLMQEFHLDPLIADELLVPSFKPKVERRGDALYVILHFPAPRITGQRPEQEIDFIIGKHFLITTRYDHIDPLHAFAKAFEVQTVLGRGHAVHGGHLFASLVHDIYQSLISEYDMLRHTLKTIEDDVFNGNERRMVVELSQAGRTIYDFRQALLPHREMLDSLEPVAVRMFDQSFAYWIHEIIGDYERVADRFEHLREALHELRDTNNSLLTTKQNEIVKTLTVVAFVTLPLELFAGIFTIPARSTPIIGMVGDFWIIVGLMIIFAATFYLIFRYNEWL